MKTTSCIFVKLVYSLLNSTLCVSQKNKQQNINKIYNENYYYEKEYNIHSDIQTQTEQGNSNYEKTSPVIYQELMIGNPVYMSKFPKTATDNSEYFHNDVPPAYSYNKRDRVHNDRHSYQSTERRPVTMTDAIIRRTAPDRWTWFESLQPVTPQPEPPVNRRDVTRSRRGPQPVSNNWIPSTERQSSPPVPLSLSPPPPEDNPISSTNAMADTSKGQIGRRSRDDSYNMISLTHPWPKDSTRTYMIVFDENGKAHFTVSMTAKGKLKQKNR